MDKRALSKQLGRALGVRLALDAGIPKPRGMRFADVMIDSLRLLFLHPKLFLPKLVVSALYGVSILGTVSAMQTLLAVASGELPKTEINAIFPALLALLVFSLFVLLVDIVVGAMYSELAGMFFSGKEISVVSAFKAVKPRLLPVVFANLFTVAVSAVLAVPFSAGISFAIALQNALLAWLFIGLSLLVVFCLIVAFYLVGPVSVFEEKGVFGILRRGVSLSRKNFGNVSKAAFLQLCLSLLSYVFAFFLGAPAALALFVLSRLLTGIVATYIIVLNPVFYLEFGLGNGRPRD